MRILNHNQGSDEWLNWRKTLLTATDAAMLLGESPYVTPYQGWQRKLDLLPPQQITPPMMRGHHDEPIARDIFIKEYKINMLPCCVESDLYNFIGASLDGISDCNTMILEIKSQRPVEAIPDFHKIQIFHQMLATDCKATKAFYVSHWEGKNITFELDIDLEWIENYIVKAQKFWEKVVFFDPPKLTDKDYRNKNSDPNWVSLTNEYKQIRSAIKKLQDYEEICKGRIINVCENEKCEGNDVKAFKKITKGFVNYKELLKDLEIDEPLLEKYRNPSKESWTILINE